MSKFIEEKWGDIVGLLLIAAGVVLVVCVPSAKDLGESAFCAGLLALKLQVPTQPASPPANTHALRPANPAGAPPAKSAPVPPPD